jgi:two-component system, LuxR family, sensor kinase FixL
MLMPEPFRSRHDGFLARYLETGEKRVIGKPRDVPVVTKAGEVRICNLKVRMRRTMMMMMTTVVVVVMVIDQGRGERRRTSCS